MSRTLTFYGHSDDLFEIEGTNVGEPDEIGCYKRGATVRVADSEGNGFFVTAAYEFSPTACWMIGLAPIDEDMPFPEWPLRWSARGYTTILEIDVPTSVVVSSA